MLKVIKQNQNIILVSLGIFLVSMTALMFLINGEPEGGHSELKTEVLHPVGGGQEQESYYREIIGNEEDAFVVLRNDGTIKYASSDFLESTGFQSKKVQDKIFYSLINPNDLPVFLSSFGKALTGKNASSLIGPYRMRNAGDQYEIGVGVLYQVKKGDHVEDIILTYKNVSETGEREEAEIIIEDEDDEDFVPAKSGNKDLNKASFLRNADSASLKADLFESDASGDYPQDTLTASPKNRQEEWINSGSLRREKRLTDDGLDRPDFSLRKITYLPW